jgi:uncharacterized protein (TIGR03067 family)
MRASALLVLLAVGLVAADRPAEDKKDQELIQGTWKLTEGERNGEKPPQEFLDNFKVTFQNDKVIPAGDGGQEGESTFKVDQEKKPKQITIINKDGNRTMKGIYELSGDTLKICFKMGENAEAPTEFSGKAGSNQMYMVLKRQK